MKRKRFILPLQPHEATHVLSPSGRHVTIAFCTLLLLVGMAFSITTPSEWQERVRVGLLRHAYGWHTSPLISSSDAGGIYASWFGKTPKTGCNDAQEQDWLVVCPLISSQMSNGLLCSRELVNPEIMEKWEASRKEILMNFETSKTTRQYACLYQGV